VSLMEKSYLKDLSETAGMLTKAYIQMVYEIKSTLPHVYYKPL